MQNTFDKRVNAVGQLGYSPREAEFVVLAALHSGYFLRRQFSVSGKADDGLCRKLLANGHGKLARTASQTQVYHLCGKPLFRTLGQEDNRHRRAHESFYIRNKIMLLDYVLSTGRGPQFLATEEDKVEYFCHARGLAASLLPAKKYKGGNASETVRYFVDKFPVRVDDAAGAVSFGYVDDGMSKAGFRTWLAHIGPLAEALASAELVFVTSSATAVEPARREFARRFGGIDGSIESYFRTRQEIEAKGLGGRPQEVLDRYRNWQRQYAGESYERRYAAWKTAARCATPGGSGVSFSAHVLPFRYGIFGDVVAAEKRPLRSVFAGQNQ
jgi:hypothetical protein